MGYPFCCRSRKSFDSVIFDCVLFDGYFVFIVFAVYVPRLFMETSTGG